MKSIRSVALQCLFALLLLWFPLLAWPGTLGVTGASYIPLNITCDYPNQLTISTSASSHNVRVSWSAVSQGVTSYAWNLYYCHGSGCTPSVIARWPVDTTTWLNSPGGSTSQTDSGFYQLNGVASGTQVFWVRFSAAPGTTCKQVENFFVTLQEIIP